MLVAGSLADESSVANLQVSKIAKKRGILESGWLSLKELCNSPIRSQELLDILYWIQEQHTAAYPLEIFRGSTVTGDISSYLSSSLAITEDNNTNSHNSSSSSSSSENNQCDVIQAVTRVGVAIKDQNAPRILLVQDSSHTSSSSTTTTTTSTNNAHWNLPTECSRFNPLHFAATARVILFADLRIFIELNGIILFSQTSSTSSNNNNNQLKSFVDLIFCTSLSPDNVQRITEQQQVAANQKEQPAAESAASLYQWFDVNQLRSLSEQQRGFDNVVLEAVCKFLSQSDGFVSVDLLSDEHSSYSM
jgi:hypothetical protein